jgi:hypothetical protein
MNMDVDLDIDMDMDMDMWNGSGYEQSEIRIEESSKKCILICDIMFDSALYSPISRSPSDPFWYCLSWILATKCLRIQITGVFMSTVLYNFQFQLYGIQSSRLSFWAR